MATKKSATKKPAAKSAKPTRATKKATTKAAKASPANAAKKRMGRPPKREEDRRTASLTLRLHPSERLELREAAATFGMTVTDFVLVAVREKRDA